MALRARPGRRRALLGQEDRDEKKWAPQVRADRQLALERSQRLRHMIGASWFFVALHQYGRGGGAELSLWYGEQEVAGFLYPGGRLPDEPQPDGLGVWTQDGRDICFLLEYDTGSEHLPQLAEKLPGYAAMARRGHLAFPVPILFCFGTPRREQTARTALAAASASYELQIATAALDPRQTGPAGPVWMTLHGGHGPMRLIDLAGVLPDPWRAERARQEGNDMDPDRWG